MYSRCIDNGVDLSDYPRKFFISAASLVNAVKYYAFRQASLALVQTFLLPLGALALSAAVLAKVYSAAVYGVDAFEVEIEVNGASGSPVIVVVGSAGCRGERKPGPGHDRDFQ